MNFFWKILIILAIVAGLAINRIGVYFGNYEQLSLDRAPQAGKGKFVLEGFCFDRMSYEGPYMVGLYHCDDKDRSPVITLVVRNSRYFLRDFDRDGAVLVKHRPDGAFEFVRRPDAHNFWLEMGAFAVVRVLGSIVLWPRRDKEAAS